MSNDDSYPPEWFPGLTREKAERERNELRRQLEELPTEVLSKALNEALARASGSDQRGAV